MLLFNDVDREKFLKKKRMEKEVKVYVKKSNTTIENNDKLENYVDVKMHRNDVKAKFFFSFLFFRI